MTTPENKTTNNTTEIAEQQLVRTNPKKAPFMRPQNMISKKPPQSRKKTTTETQLINDPLWKDSFILDGETGFVNEQAAKEFNADAAVFFKSYQSGVQSDI